MADTHISITLPVQELGGPRNIHIHGGRNTCTHLVDAEWPEWSDHSFAVRLTGRVTQDDTGLWSDGEVEIELTGNVFMKCHHSCAE